MHRLDGEIILVDDFERLRTPYQIYRMDGGDPDYQCHHIFDIYGDGWKWVRATHDRERTWVAEYINPAIVGSRLGDSWGYVIAFTDTTVGVCRIRDLHRALEALGASLSPA